MVQVKLARYSAARNKRKVKNNKIMLETSFLRKSSLKTCRVHLNSLNLDRTGMDDCDDSTGEDNWKMCNHIFVKSRFRKNRILNLLNKRVPS